VATTAYAIRIGQRMHSARTTVERTARNTAHPAMTSHPTWKLGRAPRWFVIPLGRAKASSDPATTVSL
jgi:hypothetical protein